MCIIKLAVYPVLESLPFSLMSLLTFQIMILEPSPVGSHKTHSGPYSLGSLFLDTSKFLLYPRNANPRSEFLYFCLKAAESRCLHKQFQGI